MYNKDKICCKWGAIMGKCDKYFWTIKNKLIILFIIFIIVPVSILGFYLINYSVQVIQQTVLKSSIQSNEQIIKNLDSFLKTMEKLSEYPIADKGVISIMMKNYEEVESPEYEKARDFITMNSFVYNKIKSFSTMIDSVFIYDPVSKRIFGRTPIDFINADYVSDKLSKEPWMQKIIDYEGASTITGIHRDYALTSRGEYVISVGRIINAPSVEKQVGLIIISIGVHKLEELWMDMNLTKSSKFYLIDQNDTIIFSKNKSEINESIAQVLGEDINFYDTSQKATDWNGEKVYLVSSKSELSGWRVITIIPKKELFSFTDVMFRIILFNILISVVLSVIVAIFVTTGITNPLYRLNRTMAEVANGNLEIDIPIEKGEIGEMARTVHYMLQEINRLIQKIYKEEEEKRNIEMIALQAQINPHFIYNTISVIKWMAHMQGVPSIEEGLGSFSALLSYTAKRTDNFVQVEEEIDFIKDYLKILNLRYYNKFNIIYEIDEEVYYYKTLKFLLQPVVENAIFHGLEGLEYKGQLNIKVYREDMKLYFIIKDDGKGIDENTLEMILKKEKKKDKNKKTLNSIGLTNIHRRIRLYFGEEFGISIQSKPGKGTTVTIIVPAINK